VRASASERSGCRSGRRSSCPDIIHHDYVARYPLVASEVPERATTPLGRPAGLLLTDLTHSTEQAARINAGKQARNLRSPGPQPRRRGRHPRARPLRSHSKAWCHFCPEQVAQPRCRRVAAGRLDAADRAGDDSLVGKRRQCEHAWSQVRRSAVDEPQLRGCAQARTAQPTTRVPARGTPFGQHEIEHGVEHRGSHAAQCARSLVAPRPNTRPRLWILPQWGGPATLVVVRHPTVAWRGNPTRGGK
jgi:hypothetical protein